MSEEQVKQLEAGAALAARPKLEVLDALRGFCALTVMLLHLTELTRWRWMCPHGYFPVEYFFTLTGFTFVYAYDARWTKMSVWGFFKRRLWRMQPLVVIGSLVGLVAVCLCPGRFEHFGAKDVPSLWFVLLYSFTLLPAPTKWGCIHVLQGPMWTMQYIYLANIAYAFVLRHLKTWMLAVLAAAAAVLSCRMALLHGHLEAGWLLNETHVTVALTRLAFPVLAGMLIARLGWRIRCGRLALPLTLAALAVLFFWPEVKDRQLCGLFDAGVALVAMPLIVMTAAGGRIGNARVAAVCRFMGKFSFPLFATHYQFRVAMMTWLKANPNASTGAQIAVIAATAVVMLVFAYAAMKAVDAFDAWRAGKGERR